MKIIDNREIIKQKTIDFIENITEDVYILGTNKYGIKLAEWLKSKNIRVKGFINDFTSERIFNKLNVYKSNHFYKDSVVINCIVEGRTIDAEKTIEKLSPIKKGDYFSIQFTFNEVLIPVDFLSNTDSIISDKLILNKIYNSLADDKSKIHFENLLNFRLNRDIAYLKNFSFNLKGQYFEDFILSEKINSFIDGGGYDGSTTLDFISKYPSYSKIYYFEPTERSMENSKANLKDYERIEFIRKGLWHENEILNFDSHNGSANAISFEGKNSIEVTSIDFIIDKKVDFIKLDIEGAEMNALIGARDTITKYKPILAVCIYHKQTDFHQIPTVVLEMNPEYKVFVRHYSQGVFETVMYFI